MLKNLTKTAKGEFLLVKVTTNFFLQKPAMEN